VRAQGGAGPAHPDRRNRLAPHQLLRPLCCIPEGLTHMSTATTGQTTPPTDGVVRDSPEPGRRQALLPAPQVQNHAANLAVLPDGSLGCVWFAGTQEGVPD